LYGQDIAPDATGLQGRYASGRIEFMLDDFFQQSHRQEEVSLVLEMIGTWSIRSISCSGSTGMWGARLGLPLYHTDGSALTMLEEFGCQVTYSSYTGASFTSLQR
jgi:hypothetical protein